LQVPVTAVHVDTDFGGDPDDACALALLLGSPEAEVVGVTTNLETDGRRAGCVAHYLALANRDDIPVAAGTGSTLTTSARYESTWGDRRYWPETVEPVQSSSDAALDLIHASIERDATIIEIGAFTNLARLELARPGALRGARVVATAGWLPDQHVDDLPDFGAEYDFNVQCDGRAAEIVAGAAELTLVTLPASMRAQLRRAQLPRLHAAGAVGALLARQSAQHEEDHAEHFRALARDFAGIADDFVNFHWDPVTAAVALGWRGGTVVERKVAARQRGTHLAFEPDSDGRPVRVVTAVDADAFTEYWLERVEAIGG
jgi:inosine-uridine nucleoside N-ribohydrolase